MYSPKPPCRVFLISAKLKKFIKTEGKPLLATVVPTTVEERSISRKSSSKSSSRGEHSVPKVDWPIPQSLEPVRVDRALPPSLDPDWKKLQQQRRQRQQQQLQQQRQQQQLGANVQAFQTDPSGSSSAEDKMALDKAQHLDLYAAMSGVRMVSMPHKKATIIGALAASGRKTNLD